MSLGRRPLCGLTESEVKTVLSSADSLIQAASTEDQLHFQPILYFAFSVF
jgi:hypothetical protein